MVIARTDLCLLRNIWDFIVKISTAIVSGIPRDKFYSNPDKKLLIHKRKQRTAISNEKHFHRSISKPAAERQTLLKEKKKERIHLHY